jgi:hypothetical protein
MKKLVLSSIALLSFFSAQSQVIFNEDFDGIAGPTAGGAGTYNFPTGWTLANVDNKVPASAVAYVNAAWERREDFSFNVADSAAFSTSWYSPAGVADDWMITPAIGPLPANVVLSWNAVTYDPAYPDGYQVRIMTTAPTGTTGSIGNLVTASTVLYSIAAENTAWTNRTVSLNAYAGQTVYIAFRNNSNDKYLLLIDDVKLEVSAPFDANLLSLDTVPEYTIVPKNQVWNMPTMATVRNDGTNTLTNVALKLNVYNGAFSQIYTNTGSPVASLAPAASAQVSAGSYAIPAVPDIYYFEYIVTHASADNNAVNDTLYNSIIVDDSTYARDNGMITGSLGIGAGNGGFLGQSFTINSPAALSSVSYYINGGYTGEPTAAVLWNTTGGVPNVIVASTDTILYPDDSARLYTLPIAGGAFTLSPGTYVITAVEFDSTLTLAQTNDIFRNGTTWVDWPTSPITGWANNEDFGAGFAKPYVLRLNLNPDCSGFMVNAMSSTAATCGTCADGSATSSLTGGTGPFVYSWSTGGSGTSITGMTPGTYTLTVTDNVGCVKMDTVMISNNCTGFSVNADSTNASCGTCADGSASVTAIGGTSMTYSWSPTGGTAAVATGLTPGTYTVTVSDISGCSATAVTTVNFTSSIEDKAIIDNTTIYPNPGKDVFTLKIDEEFGAETQVIITNYLGEVVYAKTVLSTGDHNVILSDLASGKYSVRFTSEKHTVNKSLTIVK